MRRRVLFVSHACIHRIRTSTGAHASLSSHRLLVAAAVVRAAEHILLGHADRTCTKLNRQPHGSQGVLLPSWVRPTSAVNPSSPVLDTSIIYTIED